MPPIVPSAPVYLQWTEGGSATALRVVKGHEFRQRERPGGPLIFWEARTTVMALDIKGYECHLQKWLQRKLSEGRMKRFLSATAGCHELDVRPSLRSAMSGIVSDERAQWLRQEATMSTAAFMAFLAWLPVSLYKQRRECAQKLFEQVMCEWMPSAIKGSFLSCSEYRGMCSANSGPEACCKHGARFVKLHLGGPDLSAPSVCRSRWGGHPIPGQSPALVV